MFRDVSAVPVAALLFQAVYVVAITYVRVVLADAALSGGGAVELRLPDAGVRRAVRRAAAERTAQHPHLPCAGADRSGLIIVNRPQRRKASEPCAKSSPIWKPGSQLSDPDPVRRAQNQMKAPAAKRFYKAVTVEREADGFSVRLDGKPVKTPSGKTVVLPTERAAQLVADEFAAQGERIDPLTMPVTRLVNTAIDGVATDPQAVLEDILRFSSVRPRLLPRRGTGGAGRPSGGSLGPDHRLGAFGTWRAFLPGRRGDACRAAARDDRRGGRPPAPARRHIPACAPST